MSDIGLKNGGILACVGVERFRFQQLNLTNFANGNSINKLLFFCCFLGCTYVNYSVESAG